MATQRQAPLQPQICSVFSSSQNLPRSKPLLLLEQVYKPAEEENQVPWIIDPTMGLKNRRSITLLASVFLPSQSEDSDSSMEISESPTSISPPRQRSLSSTSVFYDDLESSNIDVLSVSTASASIAEPSFLDSDPFADLTASPVETMAPLPPSVATTPKSPLSPSTDHFPSPRQTLAHSPVRPAHQRPAFRNYPSLPSLSTLANMHVKIPKKVRKGNVGAGLPSEPWNLIVDEAKDMPDTMTRPVPELSSEEEEEYGEPCSSTFDFVAERLGDRLSDEFELPGIERILSPRYSRSSSPALRSGNFLGHSRSSSCSSTNSYELEANEWFPYSLHTSADLGELSPLSSSRSSQASDAFSYSSSSSSNNSHTSPLEISPTHPHPDYPPLVPNERNHSHHSIDEHSNEEEFSALSSSPCQVARERGMPATPHSSMYSSYQGDEDAINVSRLHVTDYEAAQLFEPGSSASTIRASPLAKKSHSVGPSGTHSRRRRSLLAAETWIRGGNMGAGAEPAVDGGEYQRGRSTNGAVWSSSYGSNSGGGQRGRGYSSGGYTGSGDGTGSGGGGDDDDGGRKRNNRFLPGSPFSASPDASEEDEDESDEDDYGQPSGLPPPEAQSDDDDVPLARSIPTALKAQQSIRLKDREDRYRRRKEREIRAAARRQQTAIRSHNSGTQEVSVQASKSIRRPVTSPSPLAVDDLTKRLENVQHRGHLSLRPPDGASWAEGPKVSSPTREMSPPARNLRSADGTSWAEGSKVSSPTREMSPPTRNLRSADGTSWAEGPKVSSSREMSPPARNLRPMRSFHKPEPRMTREDWNAPPLPLATDLKAAQSITRDRARSATTGDDPGVASQSKTRARARSAASREDPATAPQIRAPHPSTPADTPTQKLERKRTTKAVEGTKSARTSNEHKRAPVLPAPADVIARQNNAKVAVSQQRIFIGDRQRFVVVEVSPATSAGDVLRMVEAQGALKEWRGSGGWMLFEIAQDFGMERPVRSFELLSDIEASWNKAKTVNVFLIKLTTLAPILSRSALPSSSPTHFGYVEWESKRGKWNKRYLMLKDHSLWLSKRDNGRDEVLLCSLSNFDAYQITRLVKAPKDFTFAVKSTDSLSFFENTADYLHIFSCRTDVGEKWMEKILLARSYVLHQEKNVLFQTPKSPPKTEGLSRSLTKRPGAPQPLVNVNSGNVFEPGSLLHR